MRQWQCLTCGHVHHEADGDPEHGIPSGTRWEDLPDDWCCPECGMDKTFFELVS